MKGEKLTRQQVLSIPKLRETMGNAEIAQQLGVHAQTIIKWVARLRSAGHKIPEKSRGAKKMEL